MTFHSPLLRAFTPKQLFRAGEKGVWYDPSDMSTLWQDSARTTAVTAVEQPVGCIDDKSGNGVNATQSTSASRPVLSARVNLLTKTEAPSDAAWTKLNGTFATAAGTAPDGTNTALSITDNSTNGAHAEYQAFIIPANSATTATVYVKSGTASKVFIGNFTDDKYVWVNTSTGTIDQTDTGLTGSITDVGSGWYKVVVTLPSYASSKGFGLGMYSTLGVVTYVGSSNSILFWHPDIRVSNDGVGLPAYQRVNTSTDYDTAGFPYYLRADATDDSLATGSIDFSGTDAVTVWAGVRKLSDAARGTVVELTASAASNNGSFHLTAPNAASATYAFESKGSALTDAVASTSVAAPITNVLCAYSDISLDQNILRVNGTQADSDVGDQGTGNFSTAALYIGRRGGSSLPFNGRIYGLVVRGASSTTGEITDMEKWLNGRARAY